MAERDEQYPKAHSPTNFTESGRLIDVRAEHPQKAFFPMDVIESGRVTDVRAEQSSKMNSPMDLIVSGIIMVVKESNSPSILLNACFAIEVKALGIVIDLSSSERRRIASALVKTVMFEELEEGKMEGKGWLC